MFHDQRFYVAVSFVLFFVFFGRKLWAAMAALLDARADEVRSNLDEASRLRREAEKMLEDATREREQALAESRALIERSRREASEIAERARQEAEAVASRREQMACDRIAASERAAIREVRQLAASIAVQAANAVLTEKLSSGSSGSGTLLDHAISDLPSALKASNEAGLSGKNAA